MKSFSFLLLYSAFSSALSAQPVKDTLPDNQLNQVIITALFVPTDVRQTVTSVRLLDRRTIEQRSALHLQELLQTEANIRLSQDAVLGSALSINGLKGENVKILLDGVPVTGRLNGSVDAGQLPLSAVQQVEIIEGAQSLLYGSEASAGVINLVSKKSQIHRFEAEANTQWESNGFRSAQGRVGVSLGKFLFQLNGNQTDFQPATDTALGRDQLWNPKHQVSGRAMLRYSPSKNFDIRLTAGQFAEEVKNLGDLRRPQYKPYAFDDYYLTQRSDVTLHAEGWWKKQWYWQATTGLNRFDRVKNTYRFEFENSAQSLIEGEQDTASAAGWLNRFTIASDQKGRWWNILAGVEHYHEMAEGIRIVDSTALNPGRATANDLGLFSSLKATFFDQKLTLQGGARWTQNQLYGSAVTPTIWMMVRPNAQWQWRTSYSNGFRSPGLKELYFNFIDINHYVVGNTDLQPERSHNWRTELRYQPSIRRLPDLSLGFHVSGFYNRVSDRIILAEFAPVQYRYINLSQWETSGAGAGVTLNWNDRIRFRSEVVYTGFFNTYSEEIDSLPTFSWSPDWVNDLSVYFWDGKACANIWHKTTGQTPYFFEHDNQIIQGFADQWSMLNAAGSVRLFDNRLRLNTGVKNLLNVRQIRTGSNEVGHSQSVEQRPVHWGRTYFVNLVLQLHSRR